MKKIIIIMLLAVNYTYGSIFHLSEIFYGVGVSNNCSSKILNFEMKYGNLRFPIIGKENFGYHSSSTHLKLMPIPKTVEVSWEEDNGQKHLEIITFSPLLKPYRLKNYDFKIAFSLCRDKLTVYYAKSAQVGYDRVQIWPKIAVSQTKS